MLYLLGPRLVNAARSLASCLIHSNVHSLITRLQPRTYQRPLWTVSLTGDAVEPAFAEASWSFQVERAFTACLQLYGSMAPHCLLAGPGFLPLSTVSFHLSQEQRHVSENVWGARRFSKPVFKTFVKVRRRGMAYIFPFWDVSYLRWWQGCSRSERGVGSGTDPSWLWMSSPGLRLLKWQRVPSFVWGPQMSWLPRIVTTRSGRAAWFRMRKGTRRKEVIST